MGRLRPALTREQMLELENLEFKSRCHHLLTVRSCVNHLTSQMLSFFICRMGGGSLQTASRSLFFQHPLCAPGCPSPCSVTNSGGNRCNSLRLGGHAISSFSSPSLSSAPPSSLHPSLPPHLPIISVTQSHHSPRERPAAAFRVPQSFTQACREPPQQPSYAACQ